MRRLSSLFIALTCVAACATACAAERAATLEERPSVTLIVSGDSAPVERVRAALRADKRLPIDLRFAELPRAQDLGDADNGEVETRLASARRSYVSADFPACLKALPDGSEVGDLFGDGRRDLASRILFWRLACHVGSGAVAEARRDASAFAAFELEPPADVGVASPEVEAMLAGALREASRRPRTRVDVEADVDRGVLSVDGRKDLCVLPCSIELRPGSHVLRVDADGVLPASPSLRVDEAAMTTRIKTSTAPPDVAASQWMKRYAVSPEIDAPDSVRLLSRAVRARRLALVTVASSAKGEGVLRGVLSIDGSTGGRAERAIHSVREIDESAADLLRELLVGGRVLEPAPSLVEQPLFWVTVIGSALLATLATVLVFYKPAPRAEVGF